MRNEKRREKKAAVTKCLASVFGAMSSAADNVWPVVRLSAFYHIFASASFDWECAAKRSFS